MVFINFWVVQSPWQEFFRDSELLDVIKLDLSRTYPDLEFFQSEQTQRQMLHILFVWSKLNANTSYRQGMNELLAPLLLLVAAEAIPHAQVSLCALFLTCLARANVSLVPLSSLSLSNPSHLYNFSILGILDCCLLRPRPTRPTCLRACSTSVTLSTTRTTCLSASCRK